MARVLCVCITQLYYIAGIECEALTAPENGSIIVGPRTVGSLVIYTCDDGYELSVPQPAYRQCQANGTWSGEEPTCDRECYESCN